MKLKNYLFILAASVFASSLISCENGNESFSDYEGGTTVYFAYQYPIRTLVLGADENDTSLDKAHKFQIYATMGGAYNGRNVKLNVDVDTSLCNNLKYADGTAVLSMPTEYYTLSENTISYNGDFKGCLEVQLTDAFFADVESLKNTYVIPLVIKSQTGADQILTGKVADGVENPVRTKSEDWAVVPKDYVLYCVKYINKYHSYYIRRGVDVMTEGEKTATFVRHEKELKSAEISKITSISLNQVTYPITFTHPLDTDKTETLSCELILTFNENDECTITSNTGGIIVNGSGKYMEKSEKKAWGDKDRDGIYLDYTIDFGMVKYATKDTLIWQRNGVVIPEEFTFTYNEE